MNFSVSSTFHPPGHASRRPRPLMSLAVMLGGFLALQGPATFAQTTFYNPVTSGLWSVGSTWNGGVVPPNSTTTTFVIGMGGRTISVGAGDTISILRIRLGHSSHAGGGAGLLTMAGGSLQSETFITVGSSDSGTFTQTGGSVAAASVDLGLFYALDAGRTSATWTMSGTAALTATGTMRVGPNTQSNQFAGGLNTAFTQGDTSTVSIGGDILIGATINTNSAITNVYNLDSGTLTLSGRIGSPGSQANSTNNFAFNGGTLAYNGGTDRSDFLQGLSNAFVKAGGASIDTGGRSLTIAQPLLTDATSTGGGLTKLGSGTLALAGANTYTGTTTISAGRLALGANGSFANSTSIIVGDSGSSGTVLDLTAKTDSFTIGAGQILSGGGTVQLASSGTLNVLGTFAPGNSPGLFTYEAGTTVLSGTTAMEIFGTSRAVSPSHGSGFYDAVDVNGGGLLQLGGLLMLEFNQAFTDNTTFDLFSALGGSALGGNFSGVSVVGSFYNDLSWSQTSGVWKSSNTVGGQSLEFTAATGQLVIVPEPGAIALVGIGLAVAGWSAARRRRQAA